MPIHPGVIDATAPTTIYSGLFEERSNGERLYHISTPAGIAALVETNKNNTTHRDIYYFYNDYQGSLIAAQKKGSTTLTQFSGVDPTFLPGR